MMTSFAGGHIVHGGVPVLAGVRYILPVFLFIDRVSDYPRVSPSLQLLERVDPSNLFRMNENEGEKKGEEKDRKNKKQKIDFDSKTENTFQFSFSF